MAESSKKALKKTNSVQYQWMGHTMEAHPAIPGNNSECLTDSFEHDLQDIQFIQENGFNASNLSPNNNLV